MNIDDCNGCRSEDCDACYVRREHAKHEHCLDCRACLTDDSTAFGDEDRCKKCVPCRRDCGCDSEYEHELAVDESLRDFLLNPGSPPANLDAETVERVTKLRDRFRVAYAGSDAAGAAMSAREYQALKAKLS